MAFKAFQWTHHPIDGDLARAMRRGIRARRREKGREGHRFHFDTLKNLWAADETHAVVNHSDDPSWQHWYNDPRNGWRLIGWHYTRREAQAAAERPVPEFKVKPPREAAPGIQVRAAWPHQEYTMVVSCSTDGTADTISDVFTKIGCTTDWPSV